MGGSVSDAVSSIGGFASDLIGGAIGLSLSPLDALKPKQPKIKIPGQPTMPTQDDKAIQDARRRALAMQMARGGRASTILTSDKETLG